MLLTQTEAVHAELERILNSTQFSSSPRLLRFLRYCVEQTCDGRLENLKESVIGVSVFERDPTYDPKVDPIVRVHARRLRERLAAFYASQGTREILIQVPKGGYVARFEQVSPQESATGIKLRSRLFWISISVAALALVFASPVGS